MSFSKEFAIGFMVAACCLSPSVVGAATPVETLEQGWTDAQRQQWYTLSQGSRLLPLSWMQALEQPGETFPLLLRNHSEKYRYVFNSGEEPAPLPIGFAIDIQSDKLFSPVTRLRWKAGQSDKEPWVGMNCAACHTNDLAYKGKRLRIEGAPTLANFQGYLRSVNDALVETQNWPEKWDRFALKVLGSADTSANRNMLRDALDSLVKWQLRVQEANDTSLVYGFGRLDAFGHIYNKVLLRTEHNDQPRNPSDAPVSYPFLWNIHQHDKVQWNGSAPNIRVSETLDIGALGRNVGEVTGVFADLTLLNVGPAIVGYPNSARVKNLLVLEQLVAKLKPPVWHASFPPIDAGKWEQGKRLFHEGSNACVNCHQVIARDDLSTRFNAKMAALSGPKAIGTDPWMACNAYTYRARTGRLKFTSKKFFPALGLYGNAAPIGDMLGTTVIGAIYNKKDQLLEVGEESLRNLLATGNLYDLKKPVTAPELDILDGFFGMGASMTVSKADRLKQCMEEKNEFLAYKGRPMNGIWATPPYLHNGSVPSLYDLLLPPAQRPAFFALGTREFDPERVGYVTDKSNPVYKSDQAFAESTFLFRTMSATGAPIDGNSNAGHDYGNAALSEADRWALVEYMKAVGGTRSGDKVLP